MIITPFFNEKLTVIQNQDENGRIIGYCELNNVQLIGRNQFYPNILLYQQNNNTIINPYDEKVMSLNKDSFYDDNVYEAPFSKINLINIDMDVFFFIYNFENYYHFLYDTLPYLYTFLKLKEKNNNIKLLVNYINNDTEFYRFNMELLLKIVNKDDIVIHKENNVYKRIYVSTSLTHGGLSSNPPRKEIYEIYEIIKKNINYANIDNTYLNGNYKRIYISRRTYLNSDTSNIGTNYTLRRKMVNETELVNELTKYKFKEIFCENLNTDEKIYLFTNAEEIIGSIGGGMSNLLFSSINTKTYVILSPYFLDINYRFKYSMENTNIQYFKETQVYNEYNCNVPIYVRVKIINADNEHFNKIGEIIGYQDHKYNIAMSNNDVVGFSSNNKFDNILCEEGDFESLDKGLNSPFIFNIYTLTDYIATYAY
jgi:hypothetical protein